MPETDVRWQIGSRAQAVLSGQRLKCPSGKDGCIVLVFKAIDCKDVRCGMSGLLKVYVLHLVENVMGMKWVAHECLGGFPGVSRGSF